MFLPEYPPAPFPGYLGIVMIYQNFDLEIISPHGGDRLCARVLESPQGDCPFVDVKWPFNAEEEEALLSEIYGGLRQRHGRLNQAGIIQDFGGRLFEAVFSGDIEHLFRSSLDIAARTGKGLRVRLRLPEDSTLHGMPWEFLFDTESRVFLSVREHTPIVRYLPVAQPIPPIMVEGPLRVLVALSSPTDHPRLDIAREWDILLNALEPSIASGQLELRRVPGRCTFDNLRDSLRRYRADIFHFVGHGIPGALVLEQEGGKGIEMQASQLHGVFPLGALPRLIVLNACSGAIAQDVPFSGLAQGFLRQGVPAVVAMQASITDDAALIFTRYFYRDLVEFGAVDTSLTEARLRMQGNGHPIEWGTPVLYMRALNGQLFQPAANPVTNPVTSPTSSPAPGPALRASPDPALRASPDPAVSPAPGPIPGPVPSPAEMKRPKESQSRQSASPPHVEPDLNEPRKPRDFRAKQNAPPQAGPSTPERKKSRTVRVKEAASAPKPDPDEQHVRPQVQPKDAAPALNPEPERADEHNAPPKSEARVPPPPPPPKPEPRPAEQVIAPPVQPWTPPPPVPEPQPAEQRSPTRPRVRKPTPPPKLEPILDEQDNSSAVQPGQFVQEPRPEPQIREQSILADAAGPQHPPASAKAAPAPRTKRVLMYGSAAGLLASVLVVAVDVDTFLPARDSMPAASRSTATSPPIGKPDPRSEIEPGIKPGIKPDTLTGTRDAPSPAIPNTEPPRNVSVYGDQDKPRADAQTRTPESKPKPSGSASRKPQPLPKPAPAKPSKPADNCKSAEVSERDVNCLFIEQ